jgi:hypothetical protein
MNYNPVREHKKALLPFTGKRIPGNIGMIVGGYHFTILFDPGSGQGGVDLPRRLHRRNGMKVQEKKFQSVYVPIITIQAMNRLLTQRLCSHKKFVYVNKYCVMAPAKKF